MITCTGTGHGVATLAHARTTRRIALVCALALCAATMLAVNANALHAQPRRDPVALPERLAPATRVAIERLADSLTQERLPAGALRDKTAEGVLKGADDARIFAAVRSLAARLRESRSLLGAEARDDELTAAASALFSGVEPAAISRLATAQQRKRSTSSLTIPLTIVAELASERVPLDVAVSSVESLLVRGARDADFGAFRLSIERDIQQGRAPRDAVTANVRTTLRGLDRTP